MGTLFLRRIDPGSSPRVQLKAAAEGVTLKRVMVRLLGSCLISGFGLFSAGCAAETPATPSGPGTQPQAGVPARIDLNATAGFGSEAGTGTITARVLDAFATALGNQAVRFTASAGTLAAAVVVTDERGFARTSITAQPDTVITVFAATGSLETKTQVAMQVAPPAPPPPGVPPPIPPPPAPPSPPAPAPPVVPGYFVTLAASSTPIAGNPVTLTATVTVQGTAPAPTSFAWDCTNDGTVDATTVTGTYALCNYPIAANVTAKVTVSNAAAGLSQSATTSFTVAPPPPPVVTVSCSATNPTNCNASVKVGGVQLPATRITQVDWDWGDGQASLAVAGNLASHAYLTGGQTYQVTATVTVSLNPATGQGSVGVAIP